jgi:membrane protease YdiL (CAAX protease family)
MLVAMGAVRLVKSLLPNRAAEQLVLQSAIYGLLFGVLTMILRVQYGRPFWRSLGWIESGIPVMRIVLLGLGTAIALAMLATVIGTPTTDNPMTELLKDRVSVILIAVFGVTLAPLSEELLFRGFLQPLLVRSLGALPGILVVAVSFGMLHFQEYGNSWKHALVISLAGMAFGGMRYATGSTKASTIMHASYNALFFAGLLAQGKGGTQKSLINPWVEPRASRACATLRPAATLRVSVAGRPDTCAAAPESSPGNRCR